MLKSAIIAAAFLSMGVAASGAEAVGQEQERIVNVEASDPQMNAAKARAIAELPDFYRHLARPGAGEDRFMIKFDIAPGDAVEYVWANDLDRSTTPMTGTLLSRPVQTDDQPGARISIAEADIIDWLYIRNGVAQGAYTQRVLLDRMPSDEAAALRENMGW